MTLKGYLWELFTVHESDAQVSGAHNEGHSQSWDTLQINAQPGHRRSEGQARSWCALPLAGAEGLLSDPHLFLALWHQPHLRVQISPPQ